MKRIIPGVLLGLALLAPALCVAQAPQNRFTAALAAKNDGRIKVVPNEAEKKVDVEIDGKPFTAYRWGLGNRPVLFPINTPKQNAVTRGYPAAPRPNERVDAVNQVGLWMSYGKVNGIDFWNDAQNPGPDGKGPYGTIRHKAIKRAQSGKLQGQLEVEADWVGPDGKVIVQEATLFVFEGGGSDRTITRTTILTAVQDAAFTDNPNGLLALRLARELERPTKTPAILTGADGKPQATPSTGGGANGTVVNSEQIKDDSINAKRAEWVLVNGQFGNEPISLVFIDHPTNLGHPTYWNYNGNGLLGANPLGVTPYTKGREVLNMRIPKGNSLTLKHRIRLQSGRQLSEADCERIFAQFSQGEEE